MAYKLSHITGNSYAFEGAVNIGMYHRGNGKCTLIDTGIDDDGGKRIINLLKVEKLEIDSIINTHSHADHIGGNSIIQKRLNCDIYATKIEGAIIENPIIEPLYLFSSTPPNFLKNKFLMAKSSKVTKIIEEDFLDIEGTKFEIVHLPGHSLDHIGVVSPDGVFYTGDAYLSKDILEKHGFPFYQDIGGALKSLDYLLDVKYPFYLPSHGILENNIEELIKTNKRTIVEIIDFILEELSQPRSTEELSQGIFHRYKINQTPSQYYLIWATLSAYLAYLNNRGDIEIKFYDNQLKWEVKDS